MAVMRLFHTSSYFLSLPANKAVCINAATMALIDAGIAMKDFVCACSSSLIEDTTVVGMNHSIICLYFPLDLLRFKLSRGKCSWPYSDCGYSSKE